MSARASLCPRRRWIRTARVALSGVLLLLSMPLVAQGPAEPQRVAEENVEFSFVRTTTNTFMAAPHGSVDLHTGTIVPLVARHLGAGYVVARAKGGGGKTRINVNRPTEGAHLRCASEQPSRRSEAVYWRYVQIVDEATSAKPLRLYVEIHGNSNALTVSRIEVAAKGISEREARRAKHAFPKLLEEARGRLAEYPVLELRIQPIDDILFDGACLKTRGIGAEKTPRLLHVELPASAREPGVHEATALLIAGLVKAVAASQ